MKTLFAAVVVLGVATPAASFARNVRALPDKIRAFAQQIPRIILQLQDYVATERMTQMIMDPRADRAMRKQVLLSDYQIAPLEEDPSVLWEFRFVRAIDGKPVPGSERQIDDFFRLRHRDAREERLSIAELGLSRSLPGCYWHNLTLVLQAFADPNVEDFDWKGEGDRWVFEQIRGFGIPEDLFDPKSPRHYPKGSLVFSKGSLSHLELEWPSGAVVNAVTFDFSPSAEADPIPRPARYVAKKRVAGTRSKTLVETIFEYSDYRRFSVTTDPRTSTSGVPERRPAAHGARRPG